MQRQCVKVTLESNIIIWLLIPLDSVSLARLAQLLSLADLRDKVKRGGGEETEVERKKGGGEFHDGSDYGSNNGAATAAKVLLGVKLLVDYVKRAADSLKRICGSERNRLIS